MVAESNGIEIVLLGEHLPEGLDAFTSDVRGVLTWRDGEIDFDSAIRAVMAGSCHISTNASTSVLQLLRRPTLMPTWVERPLTQRETDVVAHLVNGASTKSTATSLGIAVKTVEAHRTRAFAKLGCSSSREVIVRIAREPTLLGGATSASVHA